jgi:flagellar biosynthesis/type III secretory pathway M-ring protein FliF/YscJ
MNPAQLIDRLWTFLVGLARTTQVCFGGGYGAADCGLIWKVTILAVVIIATVVVLMVARRIIRDYLRYRAAMKRWRADQVVAPEEVMNQFKWKGDKADTEPQTQQELAAKIKEALRQNREASA